MTENTIKDYTNRVEIIMKHGTYLHEKKYYKAQGMKNYFRPGNRAQVI